MKPDSNNPAPQSDKTIALSSHDFDNQLLSFVKNYCDPYEVIRNSLGSVRIAATVEKDTRGKGLPLWPLETSYVGMDGVMSLFNILRQNNNNLPTNKANMSEDDQIMELIFTPSILCGCFAWEKVRNIVHLGQKEFDSSLLDCSCASLAKLPQWAICFNTVEQDLVWNNNKVAGVIFYRYFLYKQPTSITGATHEINNGLDGEPEATINNLSTIVIYEDGELDIGPYIELNASGTVNSYLDNMASRLLQSSDVIEMGQNSNQEELLQMAQESALRSREIFSCLAYLLNNLDKLKNTKGDLVSFASNPEPVKTKNGYRLFGGDQSRSYFLD